MVAAGGVGVLVVIAFVAVLALGGRPTSPGPGERVAVGRVQPGGEPMVLVPRCRDDRVTSVEVAVAGGGALWRIASRKGSIDERYVVGGAPVPLGFEVEVPLEGTLPEQAALVARVALDGEDGDVADELAFVPAELPADGDGVRTAGGDVAVGSFQARAISAADCPESRSELGVTTVVFGLAALGVVITYGLMVSRWWGGRGGRP
jgi:hypothetical protein